MRARVREYLSRPFCRKKIMESVRECFFLCVRCVAYIWTVSALLVVESGNKAEKQANQSRQCVEKKGR